MAHTLEQRRIGGALLTVWLLALTPLAAEHDWLEGVGARDDGATRDYYNRAALLPWRNLLGDWSDAVDDAQGDVAFASANVVDDDTDRDVVWDVTSLVRAWVDGAHPNQGLLLRAVGGVGTFNFRSREHPVAAERPELWVETPSGTTTLVAEADTYLDASTYQSQGDLERLRVDNTNPTLVRFDLSGLATGSVLSASLRLFTYAPQYGGSSMDIGVFRLAHGHDLPASEPLLGLAARYPLDEGIATDPEVVFATGFESPTWEDEWSYSGGVTDTVDADPARRFEPLVGKALRARIPEAGHTALNTAFRFLDETGGEPEEIYFRYYLRFGDDWLQAVEGGKLPGIAGRYGVAGWGGRRSDGSNGWSARGLYTRTVPGPNPLADRTPIGFYAYHADQATTYGDNWHWLDGYRGFPFNNRWYAVEQYCRMNTPGERDGVLRAWVDGRLAFEKTDIRFRDVDRLKIEEVWLNIYHGGATPSPYDQHAYLDNVVIARAYIGPMSGGNLRVLRADRRGELPLTPDTELAAPGLPFGDPDAVLDATTLGPLLFYRVEPRPSAIGLVKDLPASLAIHELRP